MDRILENVLRYDGGGSVMEQAFGVRQCHWIATAVGIAGSLASSLIGGKKSADAVAEAQREERERNSRAMAYWNRKENESILDTSTGQNAVRLANEFNDRNWKRAQGASAVGGGTDAATAMQKEAGNKMMADTMANLAVQDTARKDAAGRGRMQEDATHSQSVQNASMQRASNISKAASGLSDSFLYGLNAIDNQLTKSSGKVGV